MKNIRLFDCRALRLLVATLLLLVVSVAANAYDFYDRNDDNVAICYNILSSSDHTCEVTYESSSYNSYSGNVVIPETVRNGLITYTVISIGSSAFYECTGLTSVTIPESVTSISSNAFYYCSGLTQFEVAEGNEYYCSVDGVLFTKDMTTLIQFPAASTMTSYTIPESVTEIDYRSFYQCTGLTSVTIGNSAIEIGEYAFYECTGLTSVTIGKSVTTIGRNAFHKCTGLTELNFNATACSSAGSSSSSGYRAFYGCSNISTVNFGDNVTIIPSCLCYDCSELTEVTIPNSVTEIGSSAFSGCSGLTSVNIPESVVTIGYYAFENCSGLTGELTIPNSVTETGEYAFAYCSGLTSATIDGGAIGSHAFYYCTGLTSVTIGDYVTSIGYYAFCDCSGLTSVTIGESVTSIGGYAFYGCTKLTEVTVPNSVTSIGSAAFRGCSGLTSVTIGESIKTIGTYAFQNCSGLTEVNFNAIACTDAGASSSNNYDRRYAFYNCTHISKVNIGEKVTMLPDLLFYNCTGITEVNFNATACESAGSSSGNRAFYSCSGISTATIGEEVTTLPDYLFYNCTNLTQVTFNASACSSAGSSSSNRAFYGCDNISTVNIGDKVVIIPEYTFMGCTELTSVTSLATTPPTISSSTFDETVVAADVPIGALIDYANAEYWSGISKIYAVRDGSEYYPVIISREGDALVTASGGDENGAEVKAGATATIKPTGNGQINGYVQHGAADITETLNSKGSYSFTVSQYHKENTIYSYAISASNTFDITVSKAGDVLNQITVSNINSVYSLKVTGDINGTDILTIRRMTNLQVLDLSDANVVSGGDNYYNSYATSDYCVGDYFFYNMTSLRAVTMPNNTKSIGAYAFSGCTGLTSITIPGSVTSIANYAFKGCTGVVSVTMEDGDEELAIGNDKNATPFSDCPFAVVYLGRTLNYDDADYPVFKGRTAITSLTIGSGATVINDYEFYGCTGLTSVSLPSGLTTIGDCAFNGCVGLTKMVIPGDVESIGSEAFVGTNITTLTFNDGTATLQLATTSQSTPFTGCPIRWLYLGRTLSHDYSPFKDMTTIEGLEITSSVTKIENSAFSGCTGLTKVIIPNSVTEVGSSAFYGCKGITSLTIGNHVTSIGSSAFYNCTGLTEVKTPNSINSIGSSAFYGCSSMTTLTIGNGCTSIGSSAFANCTKLMTVYSKAVTPPDISSNTFSSSTENYGILYVPTGSLNPYWLHVYWVEFYNIVEMNFDDSEDTDPVGRVTTDAEAEIVGYYTTDGKKISQPQHGINVVRYSDGTTRKVLVK